MLNSKMTNAYDVIDSLGEGLPYTWEDRYYELLDRISVALVDFRVANNLSQKQLAERLEISQAMVSKYESGDYNISLKALVELFDKLSIPLNALIAKPDRDSAPRMDYPDYKHMKDATVMQEHNDNTQITAA